MYRCKECNTSSEHVEYREKLDLFECTGLLYLSYVEYSHISGYDNKNDIFVNQ